MYSDWENNITPKNQCESEGDVGVEARDYTPYYYFIMATGVLCSCSFIIFMDPKMRRSSADENKSLEE